MSRIRLNLPDPAKKRIRRIRPDPAQNGSGGSGSGRPDPAQNGSGGSGSEADPPDPADPADPAITFVYVYDYGSDLFVLFRFQTVRLIFSFFFCSRIFVSFSGLLCSYNVFNLFKTYVCYSFSVYLVYSHRL